MVSHLHLALPGENGRYRGLALDGVDGTTVRALDSAENRAHFGGQSGGDRGASGYPQARIVTLMALRSHLLAAARFAPSGVGEKTLAAELWPEQESSPAGGQGNGWAGAMSWWSWNSPTAAKAGFRQFLSVGWSVPSLRAQIDHTRRSAAQQDAPRRRAGAVEPGPALQPRSIGDGADRGRSGPTADTDSLPRCS